MHRSRAHKSSSVSMRRTAPSHIEQVPFRMHRYGVHLTSVLKPFQNFQTDGLAIIRMMMDNTSLGTFVNAARRLCTRSRVKTADLNSNGNRLCSLGVHEAKTGRLLSVPSTSLSIVGQNRSNAYLAMPHGHFCLSSTHPVCIIAPTLPTCRIPSLPSLLLNVNSPFVSMYLTPHCLH